MSAITQQKFNSLADRAKNILKTPAAEWDKIAAEPATIKDLFVNYVAYFAALPAISTFIGLVVFGYGFNLRPSIVAAFGHGVLMYVMAFISAGVCGFLADFLAPHFGGTQNRTGAFKLAVYSSTAAWLAGIANILPPMLRFLGILGVYSLYLFYLGVPKLMKVPANKTVAYTAVTLVGTLVVAGVLGAIMLHT